MKLDAKTLALPAGPIVACLAGGLMWFFRRTQHRRLYHFGDHNLGGHLVDAGTNSNPGNIAATPSIVPLAGDFRRKRSGRRRGSSFGSYC